MPAFYLLFLIIFVSFHTFCSLYIYSEINLFHNCIKSYWCCNNYHCTFTVLTINVCYWYIMSICQSAKNVCSEKQSFRCYVILWRRFQDLKDKLCWNFMIDHWLLVKTWTWMYRVSRYTIALLAVLTSLHRASNACD